MTLELDAIETALLKAAVESAIEAHEGMAANAKANNNPDLRDRILENADILECLRERLTIEGDSE